MRWITAIPDYLSVLGLFSIGLLAIHCHAGENQIRTQACFTTQHHSKIIPNITVYVRLNTLDFPGYDNLDEFHLMATSNGQGRVCFDDMPLGDHWFVAIGCDEEIREQVIGNIDIRFDRSNLKVDQILYVGEE